MTASPALGDARAFMASVAPPQARVLWLLDASLAGSRTAQENLTREVLIPVVDAAVCRHLFGRALRYFDREEVVQEVLIHLWKDDAEKLRQYDRALGPIGPFLRTVTRNWILEHIRREPPPEPVDDPEKDLTPDSGPENKAYEAQIWARVMEALDGGGDEEAGDALMLFRWLYLEGLSRAEIADGLGLDIQTVYKRLQEMEKKVKAVLSNPEAPLHKARGRKPKGERS